MVTKVNKTDLEVLIRWIHGITPEYPTHHTVLGLGLGLRLGLGLVLGLGLGIRIRG